MFFYKVTENPITHRSALGINYHLRIEETVIIKSILNQKLILKSSETEFIINKFIINGFIPTNLNLNLFITLRFPVNQLFI